ncbi:MAG TPA: glycerol-3-phosphate dehydrogenase/oxidase [Armatimonadota bacterium]|jgi:glycerol-3-phosphate dehydrogenase
MDRDEALRHLNEPFDVLIIGGGATGLGMAVDSASRGYSTALVEAGDFAQGASSRSTKLAHGGVRYLRLGHISLVREALRERRLMMRNAPHLVHETRFLVPTTSVWERLYYAVGLKLYDALAGRLNLTPSRVVDARTTHELAPTLSFKDSSGGIVYSDAQFNDSRYAMSLARTAHDSGAVLVNYAPVTALTHDNGKVCGAQVTDLESGQTHTVRAKAVVNATGVQTDTVRCMDHADAPPMVRASQGIHVVLDRSFLPGETAIMVPKTSDGRVFFLIPWEGRVLAGTTDTPVDINGNEPTALEEEVEFVLFHAGQYLTRKPQRSDVLSVFAGLRPLVKDGAANTAKMSRDHTILVSDSGLVTITGGKWTTYRRMAEEAVTRAAATAGLPARKCVTESLTLHGAAGTNTPWREFSATDEEITAFEIRYPGCLHPRMPYSNAMAAYVIVNEMPLHLADVLSRRLRALLLDARAAVESAPRVAALMAEIQGRDSGWVERELAGFASLTQHYMLSPETPDA